MQEKAASAWVELSMTHVSLQFTGGPKRWRSHKFCWQLYIHHPGWNQCSQREQQGCLHCLNFCRRSTAIKHSCREDFTQMQLKVLQGLFF